MQPCVATERRVNEEPIERRDEAGRGGAIVFSAAIGFMTHIVIGGIADFISSKPADDNAIGIPPQDLHPKSGGSGFPAHCCWAPGQKGLRTIKPRMRAKVTTS